ncbi:MAG TPA: phosphonate C-P lyase system protein PhnH [Burkholderiaceae bacterium]|nr:phosphonate C-P lyase system protein PhnH [Burkholderiaceae bacterium]
MNAMRTMPAGFADRVHDAQRAFRAALDALARPGRPVPVAPAIAGVALGGAAAACLLALCDQDTAVWWQLDDGALAAWLCFHTDAPRTHAAREARFAVITRAAALPALASFNAGSAAAPEASCTLLIEVPSFTSGPALEWRGPGIRDTQRVALAGLPADFWSQWQANHAAFPQGVDVLFTCGEQLIGLPRTTRVRRLERI